MKNIFKIIYVSIFVLSISSCSNSVNSAPGDNQNSNLVPINLTEIEKSIAASANDFGIEIFKLSNSDAGNIFISPISIYYALGMTYNGASNATRDSIAMTLNLESFDSEQINSSFQNLTNSLTNLDSSIIIDISNSLWLREGFNINPDFQQIIRNYFVGEVSSVDFNQEAAADLINNWVSESTNSKITGIVSPPIDPATIMFLLNAVYFKGNWATPFDTSLTFEETFYGGSGEIECEMMHKQASFSYYENDLLQIATLPYGNGYYEMIVILPSKDVNMSALVGNFSYEELSNWQNLMTEQEIRLAIPKFKFSYKANLDEFLKIMGMEVAFNPQTADFGNILENSPLFIQNVLHKTFVQVDEIGTEAAAVTSVVIGTTSVGPPIKEMRINRPFIFLIKERTTESILFLGSINNPVWDE